MHMGLGLQVTEIQTHSGATEEVNKWRREVKEKELRKQQNKEKKDKLIEEQREKAMDIWERKEELRHILMEKDQAIKVDEQAVQQVDQACVVIVVVVTSIELG